MSNRGEAVLGLAALLLILLVAAFLPAGTPPRHSLPAPILSAPRDPAPPKVEPAELLPTTPEEARSLNARTPFVSDAVEPARPFHFSGSAADRERATACLAAAAWFEAGDDEPGQRAVVQVVLNRLRHPAFPKTICGVVTQGASLRTGCQFTFTCDGSLRRRPSEAARSRARHIAERALDGAVERGIGHATHYHTDWVLPYWSGTLDKIAAVGTHLFFRWREGWGRPAAFTGKLRPGETFDPRLMAFADPDKLPADDLRSSANAEAVAPVLASVPAGHVRLADPTAGEFVVELDSNSSPAAHRASAMALCGPLAACRVLGWLRADRLPRTLPVAGAAMRSASFLYRRNRAAGSDQWLWNCRQLPEVETDHCLPGTQPMPPPPSVAIVPVPSPVTE